MKIRTIEWERTKSSIIKNMKSYRFNYDLMLNGLLHVLLYEICSGEIIKTIKKAKGTSPSIANAMFTKYMAILQEHIRQWDIRCARSLLCFAHEYGLSSVNPENKRIVVDIDENGKWIVHLITEDTWKDE